MKAMVLDLVCLTGVLLMSFAIGVLFCAWQLREMKTWPACCEMWWGEDA